MIKSRQKTDDQIGTEDQARRQMMKSRQMINQHRRQMIKSSQKRDDKIETEDRRSNQDRKQMIKSRQMIKSSQKTL